MSAYERVDGNLLIIIIPGRSPMGATRVGQLSLSASHLETEVARFYKDKDKQQTQCCKLLNLILPDTLMSKSPCLSTEGIACP